MIALVWVLVTAATVAVVKRLPAVYVAEAVILVDSQKIPEKFVSATVASDLEDRISTIRQQIMSTGKLKKIIDDFGLYRKQRETHFEEEILEMMRRDIKIAVESESLGGRGGRTGAFRIGYQGPDPALVTQVANRLTNLYVAENLKTREVQAEGTSEFLEKQLQEAKKRLDELESAVSTYKLRHNGELPQQEIAIAGTLARLQMELETNRDGTNRVHQNKIILESSLGTAEANLAAQMRALEAARAAAVSEPGPVPAQRVQTPQRRASEALEEQLGILRARYREDYPDIVRIRAEIEALKRVEEKELAARPEAAEHQAHGPRSQPAAPAHEAPEVMRAREQIASIKAQIKAADKELEDRRTEQQRILRDMKVYESRVERVPVREQEMARITRDYEISKGNYKSLLDKKIAAEMALDMERLQKSERFTILDLARVPEKPVKPKRPILYGMGSCAGLGLALMLGFVLELRRNVVLGEWELPPHTPVLARLPLISVPPVPPVEQGPRREHAGPGKRLAVLFATLFIVAGAVAASLYFGLYRF